MGDTPVRRLAAEILQRADAAGVRGRDVCAIATALGYRVLRVHELGGPVGILVSSTIAVLDNLSPEEEAITIGHELAHAVNDACGIITTRTSTTLERAMDATARLVIRLSDAYRHAPVISAYVSC